MARNNVVVPEAKEALNKFKMEAAAEVGVNLKNGYNGELTSRQAGSVGGQMVNIVTPIRTKKFSRTSRISSNYQRFLTFTYSLTFEEKRVDRCE